MKRFTPATLCHIFVLALLLFGSLNVSRTYAQGPLPPAPVDPVPTNGPQANGEVIEHDVLRPDDVSPNASEPDMDEGVIQTPSETIAVEPVPAEQAAGPSQAIGPAAIVQVSDMIDVSVPDEIRASEFITYTYVVTNTGASVATGIQVVASWTDFTGTKTDGKQHCGVEQCNVVPGSVQPAGRTAVRAAPPTSASSSVAYNIGDLQPGQNVRFKVQLRTRKDIYPKSGAAPTRPAGSARLYFGPTTTPPVGEDTAASLVVGPVLVLTKTAVTTGKIFPLEIGEFLIRLGNATANGDQNRADARDATNIVLTDFLPTGSEFFDAPGSSPVVNTTTKTVTWTIPGPLTRGQTLEFRIRFKKLDADQDCGRLFNSNIRVTSQEYPFERDARYFVASASAQIAVATPLVIKSASASPNGIPYGNTTTLTIIIQNYWPQAIQGVQLHYDIQSNAFYVAGSASSDATSTVTATPANPNIGGGRVTWTFSISAGNATTPVEKSFTVQIRAGYSSDAGGGGKAQIVAPAGVPGACIRGKDAKASFVARLKVSKTTDADPDTLLASNLYNVERDQEFPYIIEITNDGVEDANGIELTDHFPANTEANFSYVVGSSTIDGQPHAPDEFTNGLGGGMLWHSLNVPAGETMQIRYRLVVNGLTYFTYCNKVEPKLGTEKITTSPDKVCVKINPQIEIIKKVNGADVVTVNPGAEVRFDLTLTNHESKAYTVGIYDVLGQFQWVRAEQEYGTSIARTNRITENDREWPLVQLGPGQQLTASFFAKVPDACVVKNYTNEGMFHNDEGSVIYQIPRERVQVKVECRTQNPRKYTKTVDRAVASLRDMLTYTININNPVAATNVVVEDILPIGFTYEGIDIGGTIKFSPEVTTLPNSQIRLKWTIPSLEGKTSATTIKYRARTGIVVGPQTNRVWVDGGICEGSCETINDKDYYRRDVTVQPLITMNPEIKETACASPGDKRTYALSIINTNNHAYADTSVKVELPFGLSYVRSLGATSVPQISTNEKGVSTLTWSGQRIPAKPSNANSATVVYEIELEVGRVFGNLDTKVTTESPDGVIPRSDGVSDPTVPVCASDPAVAKDTNKRLIRLNDELTYRISVVNTTNITLTVSLKDVLDQVFTFRRMVDGPAAQVNGNELTWTDIQVPPANELRPGSVAILYAVQLTGGEIGKTYTNTVTVTAQSQVLDTTYASVQVLVVKDIFTTHLPLIRR